MAKPGPKPGSRKKQDVDGEDVRQKMTDVIINERFATKAEEPVKIKASKAEEDVWLIGMQAAMTNLGTKTPKDLPTASLLADAFLDLYKKKFK